MHSGGADRLAVGFSSGVIGIGVGAEDQFMMSVLLQIKLRGGGANQVSQNTFPKAHVGNARRMCTARHLAYGESDIGTRASSELK